MYWLAIAREQVTIDELQSDLLSPESKRKLMNTLKSLKERSLLEVAPTGITQQPVVMEYTSNRFIEQICEEIVTTRFTVFRNHALIKAQAKDYIRETQLCLLIEPIIDRLLARYGTTAGIEAQLAKILDTARGKPPIETGYTGGNILNLLCQLGVDLTHSDFSHLVIWQAYLRGVTLHHVNFTGSDLSNSVFNEAFSSVFSVTFSPDGTVLATDDCAVFAVALAPNRSETQILASGGDDFCIKFWDISTGQCLKTLPGHQERVWSVAFSADGLHLASAGDDFCVKIWDTSTGQCLKTLLGHQERIWSVAFSPDSQILASGSDDTTLRLWDVRTGQCLTTLQGYNNGTRPFAFSDRGTLLFTSCYDHSSVKCWDINSGQASRTLHLFTSGAMQVALSSDGQTLASGNLDHTVRLYAVDSGDCLTALRGHTAWSRVVAFSPQGNLLASGGGDQTVKLWHLRSGECLFTLQGHNTPIQSVAFSPDGQMLASGSWDGMIKLWDVSTGECAIALAKRGALSAQRSWQAGCPPHKK